MDKSEQLRTQIELLREKILQFLNHHDTLHSPELVALSDELHQVLNEYYKLLGTSE